MIQANIVEHAPGQWALWVSIRTEKREYILQSNNGQETTKAVAITTAKTYYATLAAVDADVAALDIADAEVSIQPTETGALE